MAAVARAVAVAVASCARLAAVAATRVRGLDVLGLGARQRGPQARGRKVQERRGEDLSASGDRLRRRHRVDHGDGREDGLGDDFGDDVRHGDRHVDADNVHRDASGDESGRRGRLDGLRGGVRKYSRRGKDKVSGSANVLAENCSDQRVAAEKASNNVDVASKVKVLALVGARSESIVRANLRAEEPARAKQTVYLDDVQVSNVGKLPKRQAGLYCQIGRDRVDDQSVSRNAIGANVLFGVLQAFAFVLLSVL